MKGQAIQLNDLGRSFGNNWVLRNVDLSVPEGTAYGLLGRNGAGKTTTVRMMFGLLRPSEGKVTVAGAEPFRDPVKLRRAVGYAGEDLGLYPRWRVSRVLRFASQVYEDWDVSRSEKLRRQFDLPLDRRVKELSTGMRAQLGLMLSLVRRPKVLLLDEPFGGLDVVVRREVLEGVIDLLLESGSTVFVTSHLVHELERLVDHVAILGGGGIAFAGSLESLKSSVRRIRLLGQDLSLDLGKFPWIRRVERWGRGWEVTVTDYGETTLDALSQEGVTVESVIPLSLEDIAYEYLREDRQASTA